MYNYNIAKELNINEKCVENIELLKKDGATIPFIARYRKEMTGNLDEVIIGKVFEKLLYFEELIKRKETVLKTIENSGKLTKDLKLLIENCIDANVLEDLYLPFKPKRKTKASLAIDNGLLPLAEKIWNENYTKSEIEISANDFLNEQIANIEIAISGALDIIAEWINEDIEVRTIVRNIFSSSAVITSKCLKSKSNDEDAQKYRDYFEYNEYLVKCPSHRMLAIRRGEKEGFLSMSIEVEQDIALNEITKYYKKLGKQGFYIDQSIIESYTRLLKNNIETEFRLLGKTKADLEAIEVFSENLRQLLLAAPLGEKAILAIDPGFRTGCKVVCLNRQGSFISYSTIFPHQSENEQKQAKVIIQKLVNEHNIDAIGIGNGTAGKETLSFIKTIDFEKKIQVFQVNESGASIYSASEVAREEFPDLDLTVRGSISIGRRLMDPLSELVKIDPKSIGVGQYQHDVNQQKLKDKLDMVVASCVNHVGVNVNTASYHLLSYISGLNATLAKNIVKYKTENGFFERKNELLNVPMMGPKTFEQCAGFLRIPNAINPLDKSAVHPEHYYIVEQMAKDLNISIATLIENKAIQKNIDTKKYINEKIGQFTLNDILKELEKPGLDPRDLIEEFEFDNHINTIDDLQIGMQLPGIVTNITKFGAFVDIGVKQDGMVHVSQIAHKFISDPNEVLKLQEKVKVQVMEVDKERKRIALSIKATLEKKDQLGKQQKNIVNTVMQEKLKNIKFKN
jgi:protein Tex